MAGKSQSERVAALEMQVERLTDALEETLEAIQAQASRPAPVQNPAPAAGYDPTALMVALLDRMPNPTPQPQTELLDLALKLAKELRPKEPEVNPITEATNLLAPVIMDVLSKRNGTPTSADLAAALSAHGEASN